MFLFYLFCVLVCFNQCANCMHVVDFDLMKCSSKYSPINLENVFVDFANGKKVVLAGTLRTDINLTTPLSVKVQLKKHIGFWVPVPCEGNRGSCTYPDICKYGYPENKECPEKLKNNNVPCRCPIPKGEYTLPKIEFLDDKRTSVYTGKYKGVVTLDGENGELACYNTHFEIVDSRTKNHYY